MSKSAAEVGNINARSAISTARTVRAVKKALDDNVWNDQLERGTIDRAIERAYSIGYSHGAGDAMRQ